MSLRGGRGGRMYLRIVGRTISVQGCSTRGPRRMLRFRKIFALYDREILEFSFYIGKDILITSKGAGWYWLFVGGERDGVGSRMKRRGISSPLSALGFRIELF